MSDSDMTIAERLEGVEARIAAACGRAGRDRGSVSVVAVSKTHGPERVQEAVDTGLTVFGENRVQEATQKIPMCPGGLDWHLVGHLQSNKVARAAHLFNMVHSVDSLKVMRGLDAAASERGRTVSACVQVNVSGEGCKSGLPPDEVESLLLACSGLMHVDVVGLMTIPPLSTEVEHARPFFVALRHLRDRLRILTGFPLDDLSMGMSTDFEVAIEEGATWIRLGTALFGRRSGKAWRPDFDMGMDTDCI